MLKTILKRLLIAAFIPVTVLTSPLAYAQTEKPDLVLTILHTNDLHAHEDSFVEHGRLMGGTSRLTYLIRAIRAKTPNVLTIDAGDIFQGTAYFKIYNGETEVAYLNNAGYDIYTIGNHEFDNGPENLAKQLKKAKFDIISANLDASKMPELARLVKPSTVKIINGKKIGFVGGITPDLERISLTTGDVHVKASGEPNLWITPIAEEVKRLSDSGIDKIILVTHAGVDRDKILAENIPQVDAIIGGHSHTRLNKPIIITRNDGSTCTIVQTGCFGRTLGKLRVEFDDKGKVISPNTRYSLINITDKIHTATDVDKYLVDMGTPIQEMRKKILGFAVGNFENHSGKLPTDTAMGNLVVDAVYETGSKYGATIAFHNRGGIRGRIEQGPISQEKVEELLPFDNKVVVATISGAAVKKVLEHALSDNPSGKFLNVHGIKLGYDAGKPSGERIVYLLVETSSGHFDRIHPNKNYTIAINDYNFSGGEGFDFKGATNVQQTNIRLSEALSSYLKKHPKVTPESSTRIETVVASPALNQAAGKIPMAAH